MLWELCVVAAHWGYLDEMALVRGRNILDEAVLLRSHCIYYYLTIAVWGLLLELFLLPRSLLVLQG